MTRTLSDEDIDRIANAVIEKLKAGHNLKSNWIPLKNKDIRYQYFHGHGMPWITQNLLLDPFWAKKLLVQNDPKNPIDYPGGKGHPILVNLDRLTKFMNEYDNRIDWNRLAPGTLYQKHLICRK